MDTSFRDGFQSCYGARVLTKDFLPAVEASVKPVFTTLKREEGLDFKVFFSTVTNLLLI